MNLEAGVSVIVCCHNSTARIAETLRHLARQDLRRDVRAEIIVVDNASTDNLEDAVHAVWEECGSPLPLRVALEPREGLAYARMRGVHEASYEYGIFCDDDNWLTADYLSRVWTLLRSDREIGIVGGCSVPVSDRVLPPVFYARSRAYAVGAQADTTGDVTHRGYVWGAGMGFRMSLLKRVFGAGREPLMVDRRGGQLSSGGDGEICSWYIFAGYRLWYDERLTFHHFIPGSRLTNDYYERMVAGFSNSTAWRAYRGYITLKYGLFRRPATARFPRMTVAREKVRALRNVVSSVAFLPKVIEYERIVRHLADNG